MTSKFLNYLSSKKLLSAEQKDILLKCMDGVVLNYDLLNSNLKVLTSGDISDSMLKCIQLMLILNLLPPDTIEDQLMNFKLDEASDGITVDLTDSKQSEMFVDEYIKNFIVKSVQLLKNNVRFIETQTLKHLKCDSICFQVLEGQQTFLTGISADMNTFAAIAREFSKSLSTQGAKDIFNGSSEDIVDAVSEFINNNNSNCTYKFNIKLDMSVPEFTKNVAIDAQNIHIIKFASDMGNFDLLVVPDWDYTLHREESNKARVLIADDSRIARAYLRSILESEGHEIIGEAQNGLEAYDMYFVLKPDIVTMDITMPILDGLSTLKKIKDIDPDVKIIMITSNAHSDKINEALSVNASGYITKPIIKQELIDIINRLI